MEDEPRIEITVEKEVFGAALFRHVQALTKVQDEGYTWSTRGNEVAISTVGTMNYPDDPTIPRLVDAANLLLWGKVFTH